MERRDFIKSSTLATGALLFPAISGCERVPGKQAQAGFFPISQLEKPLAIAMWDFSWLLRHHRLGSFENWDKVLDELAGRGYNAIRMDCFSSWQS